MPELPDVETFRDYLNATSMHQRIEDVEVLDRRILEGVSGRKLARELKGHAFEKTHRHGKYLFAETGDAGWLILHFGMTGFLDYGANRARGEHDRVIFHLAGGHDLAYICLRLLGRIGLTASVDKFVEEAELGPDAMGIGAEEFASRIRGSKAKIKSGLMNQKLLAGIGNIYSDEILFQARIPPGVSTGALSDRQIQRLYKAMRHVLHVAVQRRADPGRLPRTWLLPRRESGRSCPRCHGKIRKSKVAGRSAYWCPDCQKA